MPRKKYLILLCQILLRAVFQMVSFEPRVQFALTSFRIELITDTRDKSRENVKFPSSQSLCKRTKLRAMYDKGKKQPDSSILYISCAIIRLSYFVSNFVPSTYSIINILVHNIIKSNLMLLIILLYAFHSPQTNVNHALFIRIKYALNTFTAKQNFVTVIIAISAIFLVLLQCSKQNDIIVDSNGCKCGK